MNVPNTAARRVIVAGGGIGGLAAAVALTRRGLDVTVVERADGIRELGAGITIQINGMRALDRLGVADAVAARGSLIARAGIRTWRGDVLSADPLDRLAAEYGAPCVGVHRGRLQAALLAAVPAGVVRLGAAVADVDATADGVTVRLDDGTELRGDVLVGADGLHSTVRARLHGAAAPDYAGYTIWRAVCPTPPGLGADEIGVYWGPSCRFGFVPISATETYWYATQVQPYDADAEPDPLPGLRARHRDWADPVPALLAATDPAAVFRTRITDREPLDRWGRGRVTLLGDAAHPMTPNLGQGCCQALEDAVTLADVLAGAPDPAAALRRYEDLRAPRTARIVRMARDLGRRGHTPDGWREALDAVDKPLDEDARRWLYAPDTAGAG
ncbi:FAD-dependent monooxygenase [Longispora urticae]